MSMFLLLLFVGVSFNLITMLTWGLLKQKLAMYV